MIQLARILACIAVGMGLAALFMLSIGASPVYDPLTRIW